MADRRAERSGADERSENDERTGADPSDRPTERPSFSRGSHPARQIDAAISRRRTSWRGHGQRTVTEKDPVGAFLDDVAYAFADVSFPASPALVAAWASASRQWFGVEGAALVAWVTMVAGAALVRGGWVQPPGTDVPGWVTIKPWLIGVRLVYFNAALAAAMLAGSAAEAAASPVASVAVAFGVGALSVGLFPRIAEWFYGVVAG